MRLRSERRHLTKRYQARQARFYKGYNSRVWDSGYEIQDWRYGQWRTRSWKACGTQGCCMCCNARRNKWSPAKERLTLAERRMYDSYADQLLDI